MHTLALTIFAVLAVGVPGYLIKVPITPIVGPTEVPTRSRWVHLQKLVLPLFEDVCEESADPVILRSAKEFSLDSSNDIYLKPEVIANLKNLISGKGLLPKGDIFTEYNNDHMNELQIIYEVMHYAKDFDTFYRAAAWARQNVNCGLYVDAIYLSILSRRDMENISVPPPNEILPNYFIREDVIIKASSLLAGEEVELSDTVRVEGNSYILDTNYTASFYENNDESKLAYFHEDVGLNSYYFFEKLLKAPWFNIPADINSRFGEYLYHVMKQLASRCNLERYANGLPELQSIDFNSPVSVPYDPMLIYSNGKEFPKRTSSIDMQINEDIDFIKNIENNIVTVVTHMKHSGYNKTQILNHLMEMLVTSDRSYEFYGRNYLGKDSVNDSGLSPVTALEHYMTSIRDPLFWKLNKKIVDIVDNALQVLPSYTRNELYFPGVEIFNVDIKKMITNFDYFEFDVTDALKSINNTGSFQVKIGQARLNHKPFSIKINVSSLVSQKALVKIYLGPKMLPGELAARKNFFMLLDCFEINLKIGKNLILKASDEMNNLSEDITSYRTLIKQVQNAEFGLDALPLNNITKLIGFPSRLILPKGSPEGLPLQMFVFIAPFVKLAVGGINSLSSEFNSAILTPGYPLDLIVEEKLLFDLPNSFVKDVVLTHKGDDKVINYGETGETKKWHGSSYDPSTRVSFSGRNNQPFDYSSKKGQYGKKEDYSVTRGSYNEYKKEENREEHAVVPVHVTDIPINNVVSDIDINTNDVQNYRYNLLGKQQQGFGYSFKKNQYEKKNYFDYKAKKEQYRNKDNLIISKQDFDRNEVPIIPTNLSNNTSMNDVVLDKDIIKNYIGNISENVTEGQNVTHLELNNIDKVRPILRLSNQKKRIAKVYDYIARSEDDDQNDFDETDERVYE